MRPRHIPERTCVVCREKKPKRELTRIVRTPEGSVVADPTGRLNGRGAYLCATRADWVEAVAKGRLAHALGVTISQEDKERLLAFIEASTGDTEPENEIRAKEHKGMPNG